MSGDSRLMAVLKADAYGQGLLPVARCIKGRVDYYAVANANEGVSLRNIDRLTPILLLIFSRDDLLLATRYNLTVSISSIDDIKTISTLNVPIDVHFVINTGMNRYGFGDKREFVSALNVSKLYTNIRVTGIYSHLYDSDQSHNLAQIAVFDEYLDIARDIIDNKILSHIEATSGIVNLGGRYDMVRTGIGLYVGNGDNLVDAVSLHSTVQSIRYVKSGEYVGYSCQYTTKCDIIVAVVYGGYADGIDRRLKGLTVKVGDGYGTIIGDICMDVFFVDVTSVPHVKVGDDVTIIGLDNTINRVSRHMDTISYELLTGLVGRTERRYIDERSY